ncbi:MAG: hypothetical protein MJ247_07920, partial [Alphaproteobacteria bacterium]|nr:hypothetical protein [Alphaproteobacteria bacterium]
MFIANKQQSKFLEEKADVEKAEFLIQYNLVNSSKFVDMCALIKNEEAWRLLWINLSKCFSFFMVILGTICAYAGYSYLFQKPCVIAVEFCLLVLSLISKNKNLYKHAKTACRILIAILIFTVGFTYNIQIELFEELFLISALFILLEVDDLIKKSGKDEFIVPALLFSLGFYLKAQHDLSNKYLNVIFCILCLAIGIYLFLQKMVNSNTHKKVNYNNDLTIKQLLACLNISIYANDIEKNLIYASDYFGIKRTKILSTLIFIVALILAVHFNATFLLSIVASCLILFPKNKTFSSYFASIAYFFALSISIMDETNILINFHNYSSQYHPNFIHHSYAYTLTIFLQCVIIYTILRTKMSPFEKKIAMFVSLALISLGYFQLGGLALTLIFGFLGIIVNSPKIVKTSCVLITMFILYGFMKSTKSWTYLWILFWSISLVLKLFNLYLRRITFNFKLKNPLKI